MKYNFPKVKFVDTVTSDEQAEHVYSEVIEFMQEHIRNNRYNRDVEMMDLLHSIETYFRIREREGIDVDSVATLTYLKNNCRGYYDVKGDNIG